MYVHLSDFPALNSLTNIGVLSNLQQNKKGKPHKKCAQNSFIWICTALSVRTVRYLELKYEPYRIERKFQCVDYIIWTLCNEPPLNWRKRVILHKRECASRVVRCSVGTLRLCPEPCCVRLFNNIPTAPFENIWEHIILWAHATDFHNSRDIISCQPACLQSKLSTIQQSTSIPINQFLITHTYILRILFSFKVNCCALWYGSGSSVWGAWLVSFPLT